MERNYQPLYKSNFIFGLTPTGVKFKECLQILHGFTNNVSIILKLFHKE